MASVDMSVCAAAPVYLAGVVAHPSAVASFPLTPRAIMLSSRSSTPSPSRIVRLQPIEDKAPTPVLLLPPICPLPEPNDEDLQLITGLSQAFLANRTGQRAQPSASRKPAHGGLDGFLGFDDAKPSRASGRGGRAAPRPTQRQPVDDSTSVPAEVYDAMMRLGNEARKRSAHKVAFAEGTGKPYLRHHDAARLQAQKMEAEALAQRMEAEAAEVRSTSPLPVTFSPRPLSSCASEVAVARSELSHFGWMSSLDVAVHVQ